MNIQHGIPGNGTGSGTFFFIPNPMEGESRSLQEQLRRRYGSKKDPERPPTPEKGDVFIFLGLAAGAIIGLLAGRFTGFPGMVGGAIIGAVIGVTVGNEIKKHRQKKKSDDE
ncbi:glycine zipper domain-containing protein [Chloroflexota bacterium]